MSLPYKRWHYFNLIKNSLQKGCLKQQQTLTATTLKRNTIMTVIKQEDFIQSICDAFQFISYYHPKDYIDALSTSTRFIRRGRRKKILPPKTR